MKIEIDYYTDFEDKNKLEEYNKFLKKYKKKVEQISRLALERRNIAIGNFYIGIGIVSKESIRNTNKESRDIDKVTDVLSFPMYEVKELQELANKTKENKDQVAIGDIVICLEKVEEQSVEYETGVEREILYMITHGMCHLMGYDHEDLKDKDIMREAEEDILKKIEGEKLK